MQLQVKELTAEWQELRETKDFDWLAEALAGSQGRPAPGSEVLAQVEASTYSGNVFVRGSLAASVVLGCSRCAAEWLEPMTFPFDLVLAPQKPGAREEEEVELTRDDVEFTYYESEVIELDDTLREQIILQLPEYPLCRADCRGLCQRCGADLNQGACACEAEPAVDPRLARLKDLKVVK
jgi:uncharacterized protein